MSKVARSMTKQEMWDFLDREGIIEYVGEGWTFKHSVFMRNVDQCDCLACQSITALVNLGFKVRLQVSEATK